MARGGRSIPRPRSTNRPVTLACCPVRAVRLLLQACNQEPTSMPIVRLKENEPFEAALRRFKRTIEKTGLLTELRSREFYEKPTAERKRKHAAAVKRHYKRIRSQQLPPRMY